jgi:NAD-dependent deacetylase
MSELPSEVVTLVRRTRKGLVVFLTGAGISAESGIPTFRGHDGLWTVGSKNYQPTELATRGAFERMPREIWGWYLYRRAACRAATPNAAHLALAELEAARRDPFLLITQNVDGLHLRAGSGLARTYQIHGNIDFMRYVDESQTAPIPIPRAIDVVWEKDRALTDAEWDLLASPSGVRARPHVLWFDESYDEENFRFDSSLRAAAEASLLVVVGTTGATNLPIHICAIAARNGTPILVIDIERNSVVELAERGGGVHLDGSAVCCVPALCRLLGE